MARLSVRDLNVAGRRVLVRVDFNVPLEPSSTGPRITDDTRITAALPTIRFLAENGGRVILMSHLGRPKGKVAPECSLEPVAEKLSALLPEFTVKFVPSSVGSEAEAAADSLQPGEILMLENLRFDAGEEKNDSGLAIQLARLGDVYVNDAFGAAHRAHASTAGVCAHFDQCAMGFLMERELNYLIDKLANPPRPFLVIMGGAKVSDKIEVITSLMEKANVFLIGGAMAYTFYLAQGKKVGDSLVEPDKVDLALKILDEAKAKGIRFLLPADTRYTAEFRDNAPTECTAPWVEGGSIPDGWEGIDIGPRAIEEFTAEIAKAGCIVWNGPMGVFEKAGFDLGTKAVAKAVAESSALKIVGGGDSVTAVNKYGYADQMDHVSTGGGASLELLEGRALPGVEALTEV